MSVLVFVEGDDELSLQALTLGASLGDVARRVACDGPYAPAAWATAIVERRRRDDDVVGPGSDRGNEVLAHVAAQLDLPLRRERHRRARRRGDAHPLGRHAARGSAPSRAAQAADGGAVRLRG